MEFGTLPQYEIAQKAQGSKWYLVESERDLFVFLHTLSMHAKWGLKYHIVKIAKILFHTFFAKIS